MQERLARAKLNNLEADLERIVIIESNGDNDSVHVDSIVTLEIAANGTNPETCIVKLIASEINDWDLEVSINGPLGQAIFSKKVDDEVSYEVNGTIYHAKILKIE